MEYLYKCLEKQKQYWAPVVWLFVVFLLYVYVWQQWGMLLAPEDARQFCIIIGVLIVLTALCSASEIAISETSLADLQNWRDKHPSGTKRPLTLVSAYFIKFLVAAKRPPVVNAVVVLINTIITVVMTVVTMHFLDQQYSSSQPVHLGPISLLWPLPLSGSQGFTTVGITIVLFVFAETMPKQLAIRYKIEVVAGLAWWILLLMSTLILPIVAQGIITPFHWLESKVTSKNNTRSI
jgi:CBS domain containing-hemolysin-like protein